MISFIGLVLLLVTLFLEAALRRMGIYDNFTRATDWFVLTPLLGCIGCWLYVIYKLCERFMP